MAQDSGEAARSATNSASCPTLGSWGLAVPAFRRELAQFCVLCGMWIMEDLRSRALQLCQPFKAQLRRDSNCRFCHTKVGAPGRHSQQCAVLFQLGLAVAYCQDGGFRCSGDRGDLPSLFSQRGSTLSAPVSHTPASDGEQKAKAGAAPSWAAEDLGTASTSVSLKPLPTRRVTPEPKPLTRGIHADVPIDATSRGSPLGTRRRTRTHNPRTQAHSRQSCFFRELLQRLQTCSCHGGESEQPAQGRMDQPGRPLGLPTVVSRNSSWTRVAARCRTTMRSDC